MAFPADLAADTAVTPIEGVAGGYRAHLPDHWNYVNPCGGALVTTALRAVEREIGDPTLGILSATTIFCTPILAGDLRVDVTLLRRGRTAVQARAALRPAGETTGGLEVITTFAKDREGPDIHGVTMPDVPRPEAALSTRSRGGREFNFFKNLDVALGIGEPMWQPGWQQGPAHMAFWYRYRVPQRGPDGSFDALAIPPIVDSIPSALHRLLGPEKNRYMMPSLDLSIVFIDRARSDWLLIETFVERARAGYAVGSASVWDESGTLVARASQAMFLRKFG